MVCDTRRNQPTCLSTNLKLKLLQDLIKQILWICYTLTLVLNYCSALCVMYSTNIIPVSNKSTLVVLNYTFLWHWLIPAFNDVGFHIWALQSRHTILYKSICLNRSLITHLICDESVSWRTRRTWRLSVLFGFQC